MAENSLDEKHEDLKRMCARLTELDKHQAYFLLKHCFLIPKFIYILRTSSFSIKRPIIRPRQEDYKQYAMLQWTPALGAKRLCHAEKRGGYSPSK